MSILTYLHLRDSVMDTYLKVLDQQCEDISKSDSEKLTIHSHMEQELLKRLEAVQKVVVGLSADREAAGDTERPRDEQQLEQQFEQQFNQKCELALAKNRENQDRLKAELGVLTHNLENIRRFRARTGRGSASPQSRYIDIET